MQDTPQNTIESLISAQKTYFSSGETKKIDFRCAMLKKFLEAVNRYEKKIADALYADLHKSFEEAYLTEISIVTQELKYQIKHLKKHARSERVRTPLHLLPSSSRIITEPLGVALIIAPWNYPFQLLMNAAIGAVSAGCCAILKPSPNAENTAKVMEELIQETFDSKYIAVVQGGKEVNEILFKHRFDVIFFTGSPAVGRVVMKAASEFLTPVVLELGGKSPCVVDKDADIDIAARRIAWGKTINAGQTCIAPDYVLAHESIKNELVKKIGENIRAMFGDDIKKSQYFPRIINDSAFSRLEKYLSQGDIKFGGEIDKTERFFSPVILENVQPAAPVMQDEIFGPILPVLTFARTEEALEFINSRENPLAFYYFGKSKKAKEILHKTTSGGACINDTLIHVANHHMPFGGVGNSGLGKYHGKESFLAFSNRRSVAQTPTWIDLPFKYVPFKFFKFIRKII